MAVRRFVQETLGCGCPQEVFRYIQCQKGVERGGVKLDLRFNIGNRLLIYVCSSPELDTLPGLVRAGIEERDRTGLNRFRLVLVPGELTDAGGQEADRLRNEAQPLFEAQAAGEDRAHLHVIPDPGL